MGLIPKLPDIQAEIDKFVADHGLHQYLDSVTYLPHDAALPRATTHSVTLERVGGAKIQVALVVKPEYAAIVDLALTVL
jgi:hypothetical protein